MQAKQWEELAKANDTSSLDVNIEYNDDELNVILCSVICTYVWVLASF